jgi:hypothetical protein
MNKIASLAISIVVIGIAILMVLSAWLIKDLVICYDRSVQAFDDLEYGSRGYGWDKSKICQLGQGSILTLEQCIDSARKSSILPAQMYPYVMEFLQNFRPGTQKPETLESQHDEDCSGYPATMFGPHN